MLGSQILEVAIGIVFVYLLVSVICSAVREGLETFLKKRAVYLERGIRELLHDKDANGLAKAVYEHPLIYSLFPGDYVAKAGKKLQSIFAFGTDLPSYVPSKNFAVALMDIAARGSANDAVSGAPVTVDSIRANVRKIANPAVQRVILSAIDVAQGDITKVQAEIEAWYDSAMDRVSGWYKRSTQYILFVLGLVVAVSLNVDTVNLARYLYRNDGARALVVAQAQAATTSTAAAQQHADAAKATLDKLNLPIGWDDGETYPLDSTTWGAVAPILGWLMTAFAATLGAPFWFDILNKIMVIRSTVKPDEKSQAEGSKDAQQPAAAPAKQAAAPAAAGPPPIDEETLDGCDVAAIATLVTG